MSALKLVQNYMKLINESQLNVVIKDEKPKDLKPKENLEAVSRSQFKKV